MKIFNPHLEFTSLTSRPSTDLIVIHHTGERDIDASAEQIHDWHLARDWAGCGYHFIVRKDGTVEIGRPEWSVGSHCYGENNHSLGIHLSGDFMTAQPTNAQIQTCAELIAALCHDYNIPLNRGHIKGHRELNETDCPGTNLFARLDEIISLAKNFPAEEIQQPQPVTSIYDLARRYESNGDPAIIGLGYGLYQFSDDTTERFVDWLIDYPDDKLANYGRVLRSAKDFDATWRQLGTIDPGHFGELQDEFAKKCYFDQAAEFLVRECFHLEKHTLNLQAVVFSRAIQHGVFGCVELFKRTCPYPNLSYADDKNFDRELIAAVYDYLLACPRFITLNDKLYPALISRFKREKEDALA